MLKSGTERRHPQDPPRSAFFGLARRKEIWLPTWRGGLAAALCLLALVGLIGLTAHPFLAITVRPPPDVLVIDGWIPDYALVEGWKEYQRGHYTTLLTVGGPFRNSLDLDPEDDYADLGAYKLRKYIGPNVPVQAVKCPAEKRDRTFTCALTIKAWLAQHRPGATAVTVVTMGPHARRSRLLYEKALGPKIRVGVVALQSEEYDSRHWWKYSEGVKEIVSEGTAYLYARLFFHRES
jgi:hypothetical protein